MARVRNGEHKVQHRLFARILLRVPVLLEHARTIRKRVPDRRVELIDDALEQCAPTIADG